MTTELQVQENARRFATTRETFFRQVTNGRLAALEADLAEIRTRRRRRGELTRAESLTLSIAAISDTADLLSVIAQENPS